MTKFSKIKIFSNCRETKYPIQFLAVLGDIADTGELLEFCNTKEILDQLEIPYIPLFGNHDVGTDEEYEQCSKWKGQDYFDQVFWSTSSISCQNSTSTKNFEIFLKDFNFQRDEKNKDYKNFSFSFGGFNFIGLDFVSREKFLNIGPGVGSDAVLNEINKNWLKEKLKEFKENPTILLAHHPFIKDSINAFSTFVVPLQGEYEILLKILENTNAIVDFGGHIHSFEEIQGRVPRYANVNKKHDPIFDTQIFTTEALMVGSNARGVERITSENGVVDSKKGIIRIVKIFEKNVINPNHWETTETGDEFLAFNPYLNWSFSLKRHLNFPCVEVESQSFTERPYIIEWNFGDGSSLVGAKEYTKCYNSAGTYTITLTLKDPNSNFSESISKKVEIKEGIIPRTIKKIEDYINQSLDFLSQSIQMSFQKIGQIKKDKVFILKKKSPSKPVGEIIVHFENLNDDLDLMGLNADTDLEKQKTILCMEKWPTEIERSKVLCIPIK